MKDEDVKIGMKVVPHSKTGGCESSDPYIGKPQGRKQGYLFVTRKFTFANLWVLAVTNSGVGNLYNASDFEPYEEKMSGKYRETYKTAQELWQALQEGKKVCTIEKRELAGSTHEIIYQYLSTNGNNFIIAKLGRKYPIESSYGITLQDLVKYTWTEYIESVEELTLEEVEEKLGHRIKIVDGK